MDFDVVIVGGGLAGLALAAALRGAALSVALVEGRAPAAGGETDSRAYAISPASARFLDALGVWGRMDAARREPVRAMEIHGDAGGRLDFDAYDCGVGELAWIVESRALIHELWETAHRQDNLALICPARPRSLAFAPAAARLTLDDDRVLDARLVVAADGVDSWTRVAAGLDARVRSYDQIGVVAAFSAELPHRGIAFQWFRADGVLAWLPLPGQRISMVWSAASEVGHELLAADGAALAARVAQAGGRRLGALEPVAPAAGFPLRLMRVPRTVAPQLALIGDAAHAVHPLSGHGINLGFGDARALARVLCDKPGHVDCGDLALLRRFERARREQVVTLQAVTDSLHDLFGPEPNPLGPLRNVGLNLANALPVVKNSLVRYALAS